MWWTALLGMFKNLWPELLTAAAAGFIIWYAYHAGYSGAQAQCKAVEYQSALAAEITKNADLQKQLVAAQTETSNAAKQLAEINKNAQDAKQVVQNDVKDNSSCNITDHTIGVLNTLRSTSSGQK